jgi:ribosomal protein L37AE/L43A
MTNSGTRILQRDSDDDWWDCPKCSDDTEIVHRKTTTTRRCTSCDWSFTMISEPSIGYGKVGRAFQRASEHLSEKDE